MDRINLDPLTEEKQHYLSEINEYLKRNRLGYIRVPTGWGKTFLAKHLMRQYYEQGKIILFLVSRNNQLLNQTFYSDLRRKIPLFPNSWVVSSEHERIDIKDFLTSSGVRRDHGNCGAVIFASLQTVLSKRNEEIKTLLSRAADLIVVDEIHNFIYNRGNDFIKGIGEQARVLGMTATPFQGIVGRVKFVDDIAGDMYEIFSKTLPQCIIDGQLSELEYTIIRSNESILDIFDFANGLETLNKEELYLDCSSLDKVNTLIKRTQLAKRIHEEKITSGNIKTLVFCAPVKNLVRGFGESQEKITAFHAKVCFAIFNSELKDRIDKSFSFDNYTQAGQLKNAVYLSSDLTARERDDILTAFKATDKPPFVLCTVGMLIEGFDFPDLENLILLRPTLSMRLFEQQVGRVTRLPKDSSKRRGHIFEIVDSVDCLYDMFKEKVFEGNNLERIHMLQPENRIEEVFTEGNTTEAIESGKISISEIRFGDLADKYYTNSVEIPPISLRVRYFCRLLSMIEERTSGRFAREKEKLMQMAVGFKIHDADSAREISKLVVLLERLEREAYNDSRLSAKCARYKPLVFKEVRWLILLRALTCLKYFNLGLDCREKGDILHILGFTGGYEEIEDYRIQCAKNGYGESFDVSRLATEIRSLSKFWQMGFNRARQLLIPKIYWGSCFAADHPEIKEAFESKEWTHDVRRYIIGIK